MDSVVKASKRGIWLNRILIIDTLVLFLMFKLTEQLLGKNYSSTMTMETATLLLTIQTVVQVASIVVAIVLLVMSIQLKMKFGKQLEGLNLLIISCIILAIMAALGFLLGIVVFVLSGISIRSLSKVKSETDFASKLDNI